MYPKSGRAIDCLVLEHLTDCTGRNQGRFQFYAYTGVNEFKTGLQFMAETLYINSDITEKIFTGKNKRILSDRNPRSL